MAVEEELPPEHTFHARELVRTRRRRGRDGRADRRLVHARRSEEDEYRHRQTAHCITDSGWPARKLLTTALAVHAWNHLNTRPTNGKSRCRRTRRQSSKRFD